MTTDREWEKAERAANKLLGLNHSNEMYLGEEHNHYSTYQHLFCEIFYPPERFEFLSYEGRTPKEIDDEAIEEERRIELMYEAMKKITLSPESKSVLDLYLEGKDLTEISKIHNSNYGCSWGRLFESKPGSSRTRHYSVVAKIKQELGMPLRNK